MKSFVFALGVELSDEDVATLKAYDLVGIVGTDATIEQVATLQEAGTIVLGYSSAGIERMLHPLLTLTRNSTNSFQIEITRMHFHSSEN